MNLNNRYHVGIPSVNYGNSQFFDKDNFASGKQAKFEGSHEVMLNNPRPPCFQQEEPSLFHESYKKESRKLPNLERIGHVSQSDRNILKSEYDRDLLRAFFYANNKEQGGLDIPQLPLVLETSNCKETYANLKNNAYVNNEYESMHLAKQDLLTSECKIDALVESGLSVNASISDERVTRIGDGLSPNMHEQSKPIRDGLNPAISEKIWDGSLKLNTSTTVSIVAFFKSGEKVQGLNWPDHVEIKGKVKLQAFEKFIQELPRSRNRALMVISLCWKVESSSAGLEGMMEIVKGYQESEKVGFAQITPGIDLYVCPRSDIIITILAKYGFFKGMAAVEEDQSSLIGCVVWRRSQSSSNPASKSSEERKNSKQEQPVKSDGLSIQGMDPTAMEACEHKKKQEAKASATGQESALDLPASESGSSISPTDVTESKLTTSTKNLDEPSVSYCGSVQTVTTSVAYSCPLVLAQQNTSLWSSLNLLQENMKQLGIPLARYLGADKNIIVSDSSVTSVLRSQNAAVSFDGNSHSTNASENHGKFVSGPVSGPRPLIPVDSSNFQFQPQLIQMARSNLGDGNSGKDLTRDGEQEELLSSFQSTSPVLPGLLPLPAELLQNLVQSNSNFYNLRDGKNGNDSKCPGEEKKDLPKIVLPAPSPSPAELLQKLIQSGKNVSNLEEGNIANDFTSTGTQKKTAPTFQESKHVLPRPPPLPAELLKRLIQSNKNVPKPLNERIQETEVHFLHHLVTRGPADNLEIRPSSRTQIQKTCGGSNDYDDLPEFDFDSACGLSALTGLKSSEDLKERAKPSRFLSKLSTTSEPVSLTDHLEEFSPERPPIQASKLTRRSSCIDRAMELGGELRHGIGSSSKSCWDNDDDDDDMPEWCPPDAELPEQPLLSASPWLRSQRCLSNPATTAPPSFRSLQNRDLRQRSHRGLLGACPNPTADAPAAATAQSRPAAKAARSGFKRRPEPPLASHERNTSRSQTTKFDRRQSPYDFDKRHRRR